METNKLRYFIIRRANCGTYIDGKGFLTDVIGLTTSEDYAKKQMSVFCYYEEVTLIDAIDED